MHVQSNVVIVTSLILNTTRNYCVLGYSETSSLKLSSRVYNAICKVHTTQNISLALFPGAETYNMKERMNTKLSGGVYKALC